MALPFRRDTVYSELFSDWGRGVKPLLISAMPVDHSLLSAVGALTAASWGPEGGRPNLSDELRGNRLPLGSGLLPGSPRPSSPRERHGSASALGGNSISFRRRPASGPPCPSGTRCRRPTSGAGWRRARQHGTRRPWLRARRPTQRAPTSGWLSGRLRRRPSSRSGSTRPVEDGGDHGQATDGPPTAHPQGRLRARVRQSGRAGPRLRAPAAVPRPRGRSRPATTTERGAP